MNRNCWASLLPLIFIVSLQAEEPSNLLEAVKVVSQMKNDLKGATTLAVDCLCSKNIEPNEKFELNRESIDIGQPLFLTSKIPYVYQLKRTSSSPEIITLKFKNGHTECSSGFLGAAYNNGPMLFGCVAPHTVFEVEEIELNFKKWPRPKEGENQLIELKINKPDNSSRLYSPEVEIIKGPDISVTKKKYLLGNGQKIEFTEKKS